MLPSTRSFLSIILLTFTASLSWLPHARAAGDILVFSSGLDITNAIGALFGGEERGGIFVMRPDGTGLRQLTSFQTGNFRWQPDVFSLPDDHPTVSPDGRFILFSSSREDEGGLFAGLGASDNFEVFIMRVNGSGVRRLTFNPLFDGEAVFSPDGTKIAFVSQAAGLPAGQTLAKPNIFVMDVNGNVLQRVTASSFSDIEPAWSPDGTPILGRSSPRVALGDGDRRHHLAPDHRHEVARAQLVAAELVQRRRRHVGLDGDAHRDARVVAAG